MSKGFAAVAAAAFAVGALAAGGAARAEGSMSVLGTNAAGHCSEAAATAARGGRASAEGVLPRREAIKHVALSSAELAASYVNRGVLHLALSNYAASVADDDAALQLEANLPDALVNRGAALVGLVRGDADEADENARRRDRLAELRGRIRGERPRAGFRNPYCSGSIHDPDVYLS